MPLGIDGMFFWIGKLCHPIVCISCITCYLNSEYNVARAVSGATCEASSYSDPDHTCREALLGNVGHWQADGEGSGAWMKVSFPRANVGRLGILSGCGTSTKIRTITVDMDSTGEDLFEVCYQAEINLEYPNWQSRMCHQYFSYMQKHLAQWKNTAKEVLIVLPEKVYTCYRYWPIPWLVWHCQSRQTIQPTWRSVCFMFYVFECIWLEPPEVTFHTPVSLKSRANFLRTIFLGLQIFYYFR